MKQTKMFKAWKHLDSTAGCYWKPDQADVWIAFMAGCILGLVVAFQF